MDINAKVIGDKIAKVRKAADMTQSKLADKVMMSPQLVSKWEKGESLPDVIMLKKLSEIFDVDINYFLSEDAGFEAKADETKSEQTTESKTRRNMLKMGSFKGTDFSDVNLKGKLLNFSDMKKCSFDKSNLEGCNLKMGDFKDSTFVGVNMKSISAVGSDFAGCSFDSACMQGMKVKSSTFKNCIFDKANLEGSTFLASTFFGVSAKEAVLDSTEFDKCSFKNSTFECITIKDAVFRFCTFTKTNFIGCTVDKLTANLLKSAKAELIDCKII